MRMSREATIGGEGWSSSFVIFTGAEWPTEEGKAVLGQIHQLLKDRLSIGPTPWPPPGPVFSAQSSPVAYFKGSDLRGVYDTAKDQVGRRCSLFPVVLLALYLFYMGRDRRRLRRQGYWALAGLMLTHLLIWLGILTPLTSLLRGPWPRAEAAGLLVLIGLVLTARAYLEYRRVARAWLLTTEPAAAAEAPAAKAASAGSWVWPLLAGAVVAVITSYCTGAALGASLPALLGLHSITLAGIGRTLLFWVAYCAPVIATVVVAVEVGGLPQVEEWARERPPDTKKAAALFLLAMTAVAAGQLMSALG